MTTTAHVEVLTAEVRVLVVGSRQITISVYNQLDPIRPHRLDPFGRVRRRAHCWETWYPNRISRDCPGDCLDFVGRTRDTGALARCCIPRTNVNGNTHPEWQAAVIDRAWDRLPLIVLAGLR
jgi:hypothetical protein